ncbi:polysaccharide biosynthesis C-terminal domain-containing protein [Mobilicoccus pelagius]|uniref:Putative nucleoside-diphosphate-sugar epimerase n=1 Tax=Mobilicoccus pelagius NBRC 104925 TaxID=1089455 RepID=H5UMV4_9MICO|nr:NAD-dependent epimerase/dehydratase family protein [Mobilicoccus pelagius]GAB47062.1 putative nucleoside-diphosphate-sugar epimerase [Mobilicoccus pelagius NBRC 104925]
MRVVVTGAAGFLGWHTRTRLLLTRPELEVVPVGRAEWPRLCELVTGADAVLHLAGHNRGEEDELAHGNVALATDLTGALDAAGVAPTVVYAGSTYVDPGHWGVDSPYAAGKRGAGDALREWATRSGAVVREVRLPGLFGEHGRPEYNSFVATFAHRIAHGEQPSIVGDRELPLLHVQDAAEALLDVVEQGAVAPEVTWPQGRPILISEVAHRFAHMHEVYAPLGEIPALADAFDVALFNTLRAAMWPDAYPLRPTPRSDERGTLVETIRVHGGTGQAFVSSTNPGYTRGDHVHLHKIERFQVLSGTGLIRLRRVLTDEVLEFRCTGDEPAVVDMPTMWTHSIENVGDTELVTAFWTNDLLDPENPDTYPLPVLTGRDRTGA